MDITEIKSFLAVVEYRSYTLAAKKMNITQSTMSKRIRRLEDELDSRLFIMEGARIVLTDAANYFVPYARQIVAAYNNMLKSFKAKNASFEHHLLIGASIFVSNYVLPDFLNFLKIQNSKLQLYIKTMSEFDIESYLKHGLVDIVICPEKDTSDTLGSVTLWCEHYALMVSKKHALAKNNKMISISDLETVPAILSDQYTTLREKVEQIFQEHSANLNIAYEISTVDGVKALLEHDLGWGFLPKNLISDELYQLKTKDIDMNINFNAYFQKRTYTERGVTLFLEYFQKWRKSLM